LRLVTFYNYYYYLFLVPKEKFKTHEDEPDSKETKNQKKPKSKVPPPQTPLQQLDYYFKDFRRLCMNLSQENSHLQKTAIFKEFINNILSKGMHILCVGVLQ